VYKVRRTTSASVRPNRGDVLHSTQSSSDKGFDLNEIDPIQHIHANAMQAHGGPYDLALDFGYRADQDADPDYRVRVSMSWEHAASIVSILQRLIEDYERQVPSISAIRDKMVEAQEAAAAQEESS